jgi:hypothetical protein
VGNYIEIGQFKSVRSRTGTKWSKKLRKQNKESRLESTTTHTQPQTTESQRNAEQEATDIIANVKVAAENVIDWVNRLIPAEFPHQQDNA